MHVSYRFHHLIRFTCLAIVAVLSNGIHPGLASPENHHSLSQLTETSPLTLEGASAWVNLSAPQSAGDQAMAPAGVPLSLAALDLNGDGTPELVAGYQGPEGGSLVLFPGNPQPVDSEYFFPQANSLTLSHAPDWLGVGDFNADGIPDLVTAAQASSTLYYLLGDGTGGLGAPREVPLPAGISALVAGEIDRQDGTTDLVVALDSGQVLIYAGGPDWPSNLRRSLNLRTPATALAIGQLDDDFPFDLVLAGGTQLHILHGQDHLAGVENPPADLDTFSLETNASALALGDFQAEEGQFTEIAVLSTSGSLSLYDRNGQPLAGRSFSQVQVDSQGTAAGPAPRLLALKTSTLPGDDLLLVDAAAQSLRFLNTNMDLNGAVPQSEPQLASLDTGGAPQVVLPLRLNQDALSDLVFFSEGLPVPQYSLTTPVHTFVVTHDWNLDDTNIGDGECNAAHDLMDLCTIRAAIQEANASAGLDEIIVAFKVVPNAALPQITEALILNGNDLSGEINGGNMGFNYGLYFNSGSSTVQNIKLREFQQAAIYLPSGGSHLINGCQIGSLNLGRGITVKTNGNTLSNNLIVGNIDDGVGIENASGNTLTGNRVGVYSNDSGIANRDTGIYISNAPNTIIGGSTAVRNVIAANWDGGIHITNGSAGTLVQGNYIGIKADGVTALGNDGRGGIDLENATSITIGGTSSTYRNVISANRVGIKVRGDTSSGNLIRYNYIGVSSTGSSALPNLNQGIYLSTTGVANSVQVLNNQIGGNSSSSNGVWVYSSDSPPACISHTINNNIIGTDAALSADLGLGANGVHIQQVSCVTVQGNTIRNNDENGILITGGMDVQATIRNNALSYNGSDGLQINTNFNTIEDNHAAYNQGHGILVNGDSNTLNRNAASFNNVAGIVLEGDNNGLVGSSDGSIVSMYNGLSGLILSGDANQVLYYKITANTWAGVSLRGDNNIVGGLGTGNWINGNGYGVEFLSGATGNQLVANYIGVEADGSTAAGNALANILLQANSNTIGGGSAEAGNLIADAPAGILVQEGASGNTIRYNKIGTNAAGTNGLPNGVGIKVASGYYHDIMDNTIAYNGDGVIVESGFGISLYRNRIFNSTRLGIDLFPAGVTLNDDDDTDTGPNNLLNYPVISAAGISGKDGHIQGSIFGEPNATYTLNFFSVPTCDPSGYGEGQNYLGTRVGTTDLGGHYTFDYLTGSLVLNEYVTAIVTSPSLDTSEFSRCVRVGVIGGSTTFTVNSTSDAVDASLPDGICDSDLGTAGEQCTLRAAIQQANANSGANTILLPGGDYTLTRPGTSENAAATGDLDITGDLVINGAGANAVRVNANGLDRVFEVRNNAVVILTGLTISGGRPGNSAGGGVLVNTGCSLTLESATVGDNQVGTAGGGGIYNQGSLTVSNSAIINNQAGLLGGGLYQFGGTSTLLNSTLSGNTTAGSGGGIAAEGSAVVGLKNVTVAFNTADSDNNGGDGGGLYQASSTVSLQNSIIAENEDLSYGSYVYGLADCAGTYTSDGYNLIGDQAKPDASSTPGCILNGGTGDSLGGFWLLSNYQTWWAGLGALQLNGGTTPNHSPVSSAAGLVVDWGNPGTPGSGGGTCEGFDQRGQPRPIDGGTDGVARCDRGAVEHIPVMVSINDATTAEGSLATFNVSLSSEALIEFTVHYSVTGVTATAGSDFTAVSGVLTFPVSSTLQTIQVPTLNDTYNEADETFQVTISLATYVFIADGSGLGTIQDSDPQPSLLVNDVSTTEGDSGTTASATFNVTLNSTSGKEVRVDYSLSDGSATAGEDFSLTQGTLTFPAGTNSRPVSVTILGDNLKEGNETFTLTLSNPVNASLGDGSGTGTILDDDVPSLSVEPAQVSEPDSGSTTLSFSVLLSKPSTAEITVKYVTTPGSAAAGSDYFHTSGTLTFAAGEVAQTIPVVILGDTLYEENETFTVSLNTPTGGAVIGTASAQGTIQDNDMVSIYVPVVFR